MRAGARVRARARNAGGASLLGLSHPIVGFETETSPKNPDQQKIPIEFGV